MPQRNAPMNDAQRDQVLQTAHQLISAGGYSALTYDAIAAQTNLPTAAIQAQFPDLTQLAADMLQHYYAWLEDTLSAIDAQSPSPPVALTQFVELYRHGLQEEQLCLCGLMAAESKRLPEPLSEQLRQASQLLQIWLTRWFEQGQQTNTLTCLASATIEAQLFAAALQGAQLATNLMPDGPAAFQAIAERLLLGVGVTPERPPELS